MKKFRNLSKKAVAFLIAIMVVLSSIVVSFAVITANNIDVWDGTVANAYESGSGTQADPYLIATPEQLARMIGYDVLTNYSGNIENGSVNKYYKLTADIYLNDVSKANWYEGAKVNYWYDAASSRFCGNFDGDGHTVYGLCFADGATAAGLIPVLDSWSADRYVKNVTISHSYMVGKYAGGIVGRAYGGNYKTMFFENCYVDDTVVIDATTGGTVPYAGGFVGFSTTGAATKFDLKNCAALATKADGTALNYAICGVNFDWYGELYYTVTNTFAHASKWHGLTTKGSATDSYLVTDLKTIVGEAAKTAMPDLKWDEIWFTTSTYPNYTGNDDAEIGGGEGGGNAPEDTDVIDGPIWNGTVAEKYAGGSGTKDDPYQIANGAQLAKFTTTNRSASTYAILTNDIYLNDASKANWKETAKQWPQAKSGSDYFKGNLDGDGHMIYGLYINSTTANSGLVAMSGEAVFQNIVFRKCSVNTKEARAAIIVGRADPYGTTNITFKKIYVDETCEVLSNYGGSSGQGVAAFAAVSSGNIVVEKCAVLAKINNSATGIQGAYIGQMWNGAKAKISGSFTTKSLKCCGKVIDNGTEVTATNCYGTQEEAGVTVLTAAKMKGSAAKTNMPNLDWITAFAVDSEGGFPKMLFVEGFGGNDGEVWSGLVATKFTGGSGTDADPYLVSNGEQLAFAVSGAAGSGKYYKLVDNIKLNDTTKENWKATAQNWVTYSDRFSGTIDGDGYTIDGLFYNGSNNCAALIRLATNVTVKNLKFTNASMTSTGYGTAVILGSANGSANFSKVYVDETCEITSTYSATNDKGAAGFVGYGSAPVTIDNSAFLGKVTAPAYAGAFVGNYWGTNPTITNSFSSFEGRLSGKYPMSTNSANNYGAGTVAENGVTLITVEEMKGAAAKTNMPNLDWKYVWQLSAEGKYPTINAGGFNGIEGEPWEGVVAGKYAGGKGTKEDPYLINTAEQLAKLVKDKATAGKFYKITADIIVNDTTKANWKETAKQWYGYNAGADFADIYFQGTLDGNGKKISGLYYNGTDYYVGLFAAVKGGAVIKNVIITDSHFESSSTAGTISAFTGYVGGSVKYEKCIVTESVTVKGGHASGYASYGGAGGGTAEVETCASYANIEGAAYSGAFFADIWSATLRISNSIGLIHFSPRRAFTGSGNYGLVADDYGTNVLNENQMKGEAAKKNMPLLNWDRSWKTTSGYPTLEVGDYEGKPGQAWSGKLASKYAGGKGTKEAPYLIATPEQLAMLVANVTETNGEYYKLTHDIYINDIRKANWEKNAKQWFWVSTARFGAFTGHFDGNGHMIYGLYLNLKQTESVVYSGLFPTVYAGSTIKNLGFSGTSITVETPIDSESYVGSLTAMMILKKSEAETTPADLATVSQVFGDRTCHVNAKYAGGIIGGGAYVPHMDNCYYVGKVSGERIAAIIGNTWTAYKGAVIENCYSATDDELLLVGGRASVENSSSPITYKNNYSNANGLASFVSKIGLLMMRGDKAKNNMPTLDFNKIWYALPNGTPVLRQFGKTDKYSNTTTPDPIKVSFVTNGGTACESIYGNPEDPMKLPTPTREGYKFAGWHVYKELDFLYPSETFPYFDTILYANWTATGVIVDFEDYADSIYDYGEDYEYYKPGVAGYDANYVKSGMASIHRLGATSDEQDFLLNYEDMLEIGKTYKLSFWVTTDKANTKATLSLVHEEFPDVFDNDLGVQEIKVLEGMKAGEWQLVEVNFVAKTKWLAIRTSGNASLFFDDAMMIPTDEKVDMPIEKEPFNFVPVVIIAAVVIVLIAGAIIGIIVIKKKKA